MNDLLHTVENDAYIVAVYAFGTFGVAQPIISQRSAYFVRSFLPSPFEKALFTETKSRPRGRRKGNRHDATYRHR